MSRLHLDWIRCNPNDIRVGSAGVCLASHLCAFSPRSQSYPFSPLSNRTDCNSAALLAEWDVCVCVPALLGGLHVLLKTQALTVIEIELQRKGNFQIFSPLKAEL